MQIYRAFVAILVSIMLLACAGQSSREGIGPGDFNAVEAAKTRISLGLTYLQNGNYTQAKFNLDKALQFAPNLAEAHFSLAYYYQVVGEFSQAEAAYQQALSRDRNNADIANSYGVFLCENGQYEKAKRFFLSAVNNNSYARVAETYENLAICSQNQGKFDDALVYLSTALNHQPSRAKALRLMSQLLIDTQQYEQAEDYLRRYERVAGVSAESLWKWVQLQRGLGNDSAARQYGATMASMFPDAPQFQSFQQLDWQRTVSAKTAPNPSSTAKTSEPTEQAEQAAVATVTASEEGEPELPYHIVQAGENLYRISLKYNIQMQRLIDWNDLADASAIYAGKRLLLQAPTQ